MKKDKTLQCYEPKEFEKTELFKNYSEFCQNAIHKINEELIRFCNEKAVEFKIYKRNGTDEKITFKLEERDPVILTIAPKKKEQHANFLIKRKKILGKETFEKKIECIDDLWEVLEVIKELNEKILTNY
ncbi:hypothetical protein [Clostridium saccharobutylicum]|uniref:DUF5655 domain-containing protein n=1 Tax=Clostridium saccharobutylicum TaxID=169679 RepID=A0A1S8MNT8_CLOSA|nr:hypothetical protein [Clostridium saccharobutylicum]OOM05844.1 hypothetical protein CLOSAC_44230 [Clostridium saccharobutylicum]OOM14464.1 hypothetical protein CLOSAC_13440 [Clostridium saccharobutylicum]